MQKKDAIDADETHSTGQAPGTKSAGNRSTGDKNGTTSRTRGHSGNKSSHQRKRPCIRVKGGSLSDNATRAEQCLIAAGVPIFRKNTDLVRPVTQEVPAADGRKTRTAALLVVSRNYMRDILCQHIDWHYWDDRRKADNRGEKWRKIDAPMEVADTIIARAGHWKFPAIVGITSTPTLRPDGSVLSQAGYDKDTGLILFEPPTLPNLPQHPTKEDAVEALKLLNELLDEFPFVDDESRSVALSALITPAVRAALSAAPMHVFTAPTAGTGKSYLVDIVSGIYSGVPCPVIGKGETAAELEKRLHASLVAGHPMVSIDNVNGDLGGDYLCHAIERPSTDVRLLGRTQHQRITNTVTLFATGNNLRLVGDVIRRSLVCRLDAKTERPELRTFRRDPIAAVLENRGRYIGAALTVVRAYLAAGRPLQSPVQVASFQKWSDLVRSSLLWIECADPLKSMERARESDPELEVLKDIFSAMASELGRGPHKARTAAQIVAAAYSPKDQLRDNPLRDALDNLKQRGKSPDAVTLGQWLARQKDRLVDDLQLFQKRHGKHPIQWYVDRV